MNHLVGFAALIFSQTDAAAAQIAPAPQTLNLSGWFVVGTAILSLTAIMTTLLLNWKQIRRAGSEETAGTIEAIMNAKCPKQHEGIVKAVNEAIGKVEIRVERVHERVDQLFALINGRQN